ncbi:MAG: DUF2252 family protein [Candidatus Hydrogenedentales bacterium]
MSNGTSAPKSGHATALMNRERDRRAAFAEFAQRRAEGAVVLPPQLLTKEERRLYIRETLREDHRYRVHNQPEGAQAKFDKLQRCPFTFFRGTALLYYRDYAGTDGHLPVVFTVGDVHPDNFGVMPNENGAPFFGINDFDEAYFAPFSWDVKRGALGFYIAAKENGFKKKGRLRIVHAFVEGYLRGLEEYARDDREKSHEYRLDNSPPMIKQLIENSHTRRKNFLEKYVDLEKGRFLPTEEIVPYTSHVSEFQEAVEAYCKSLDVNDDTRAGHFTVKDVAIKKGSGTASLGLERYWVLIDGPSEDNTDDLILEFKHTRPSALAGLSPSTAHNDGKAERVVDSHRIHLVGGDPYYGTTTLRDESFLVRERSPYKNDIDVADLDAGEMEDYAEICGKVLAQSHARSDEDTGIQTGNAEERILEAVEPGVFVDDVRRFAVAASERVYADFSLFKKDYDLGAFTFVRDEVGT